MPTSTSAMYADSKPHYHIIDGLRGVAAFMVLLYHIFEGFATSPMDQSFNHGFLAVDFFFVLSGFVIGYAYDDRWQGSLTPVGFYKRRLIRLHPMVVLGAVLGLCTYLLQGGVTWHGEAIPLSMSLVALLLTLFLLPVLPGSPAEVRGNGEMFPLNGPYWSLFFEYIGSILYALLLRRLKTPHLFLLTMLLGLGLLLFAVLNGSSYYNLGVGWTFADNSWWGGLLRMMFSYSAGLWVSRVYVPYRVRGAFILCSLVLFLVFLVPYIHVEGALWLNGLYEFCCIAIVFPLLVWLGASGRTTDAATTHICNFLGNISYPLYIIHYPFMYLFFAWLWHGEPKTMLEAWPVALGLVIFCVVLAYAVLRLYDEPVRHWLKQRFIP